MSTRRKIPTKINQRDHKISRPLRESPGLVAFARVLPDFTFLAVLLDVVVDPELRSQGAGAALMNAVTGDPRLAQVRSVELVCQPELYEFYRRWGFTTEVGASRLMRRTDDPLLRNAVS